MPPKINRLQPPPQPPKPIEPPKPKVVIPPTIAKPQQNGEATLKSGVQLYGEQKRDQIERLYGAGAAGISLLNTVGLAKAATATENANNAYKQTFNSEFDKFSQYAAKVQDNKQDVADGKPPRHDVSNYDGAKNYIEVTRRAETAYRGELSKAGLRPSDVNGTSAVKALDFMTAEANNRNGLSSLSGDQIRARVQNGENPTYIVRLVENKYLDIAESRLTGAGKQNAWVATADELAGAKGDLFETMKRIGYSDSDIDWARTRIKNGEVAPSDWSLAIMETDGTRGRTTPTWDAIIDKARTNSSFNDFDFNDPKFVDSVKNFEFDGKTYADHANAKGWKTPIDDYIAGLKGMPAEKAEALRARFEIENKFGANPLYTGDGTTLRPDAQNGKVGAREFFVDNIPLREQQRTSFMPMRDTGLSTNPNSLEVRPRVNDVVGVPRTSTLGGEMRAGGLAGAGISTVTSLPQIFDQARSGDYLGAGQTLVTNAGTGAIVGSGSAAGERFVSKGIEQGLTRSGTQIVSSNAARQVVSRVAGSSIVGGIVNGGFSAYDQIGAYNRGEVTGSQAIGTITGEVGIGLAAGATGAAAGAAIGSIVPIAGTAVGAVVGFVVGVGVGMATDAALRYGGVDKMVAHNVTAAIDRGSELVGRASNAVSGAVSSVADGARNLASGAVNRLSSVFGW
ncbi:MAG: hypothetical protein H7Z37_06320 [Pyrinomonadaceae bacterium]|nr:hypothetical protein [Pyrinomonadaceae bacterium]